MAATTIAYSYIRFSSPEQAKGDSLRRQTERAEEYCRRRGWTLDTTLTLRDLGVSAFHGDNALFGNLGVFLQAVKRGAVTPGSVLIVESIDRISRQGIDEGYDHIKGILKAGVRLVTLSPEREFDREAVKSLSRGALEIQLILERAAEESERKSDRQRAAWEAKRRQLRNGDRRFTRHVPAWIEYRDDGQHVLIPERAAAVRRMFELAAAGYTLNDIVRKLPQEGHAPFGARIIREGRQRSAFSGQWQRPYVSLILRGRAVLGELQPCRRVRGPDGKEKVRPDGPPVPGCFPAVVTEAVWDKAQGALARRRGFVWQDGKFTGRKGGPQGRRGDGVNLFRGLLRDARDGSTFYSARRPNGSHLLVSTGPLETGGQSYTFPYEVFESSILSCLTEIDPRDILPANNGGPDESHALASELAGVEARLAEVERELETGDVAVLARVARRLEERKQSLLAQLAEAKQKAASPVGEAWGEAQSLARILADATDPDDMRTRLRAALRRIIDRVWVHITVGDRPSRFRRRAFVQIDFQGGGRRYYVIGHRPAGKGRKEEVTGGCWDAGEKGQVGWVDLAYPEHLSAVNRILLELE
jgi:DNA invertase Pin-like site-specific DNA recombinase